MANTIIKIPGSGSGAPQSLGLPVGSGSTRLEPSGLTLAPSASNGPVLVMVSDNGGLGKMTLPYNALDPSRSSWTVTAPTHASDKSDDYECAACVGGNADWVLVGVEGYRTVSGSSTLSPPLLKRLSAKTMQFQNDLWSLAIPTASSESKSNSGMEALTDISNAPWPSGWSKPANSFLMLTAVQSKASTAYIYAVPVIPGVGQSVPVLRSIAIPQPDSAVSGALISELFFDSSSNILYVLYDGGSSSDYFQALQWTVSNNSITLNRINVAKLPWTGCEGMVVKGADLFFCTDDGKDVNQSKNGVYVMPGFVIGFVGG
jgi:hypothetical protein